MKKRITIIGINYYPEDTAIGLYTSQLAEYFQSEGIEVKIITGFPYYPSWEISSEYQQKKLFLKERINGIDVFRYKQYVPKNPTFFKRIIHLLDFTFGSLINIFHIKKTDVVLCVVPFTSTIFLGKILSKLRQSKLWIHIQDFEFDVASDSDIVDKNSMNNIIFKILFWIEKKFLNQADIISTISTAMIKKLDQKVRENSRKYLLPNWVDIEEINPTTAKPHPYLKSKKFKILYSGNIGEKQNWEFFLLFVKELENNNDIEFIIVGNGSKKEWLVNKLTNHTNVKYYLPVTYDKLSDLLCNTDIHILFQKEDVIDTVMPSKILAMMASQKPSLVTGNLDSEVAAIIKKSNGGKYFESNNISEVVNFVYQLKKDKKLAIMYGEKSRKYVTEHFSKEKILNRFKNTFFRLID